LKSGILENSPPVILRLVRRRLQGGCQPIPNAAEFHITFDDLCIPKPLQTVRDLQIRFLVGTVVFTTAEEATVKPNAGEQRLDLYSEMDTHGGTRYVWLRLTSEGNLILEGQDLGGAVDKFWGASEYEWAWSLHPERLGFFLESLGMDASEPANLLNSIGAALNVLDRTEIEKMFEAAGATFWSRAGD